MRIGLQRSEFLDRGRTGEVLGKALHEDARLVILLTTTAKSCE